MNVCVCVCTQSKSNWWAKEKEKTLPLLQLCSNVLRAIEKLVFSYALPVQILYPLLSNKINHLISFSEKVSPLCQQFHLLLNTLFAAWVETIFEEHIPVNCEIVVWPCCPSLLRSYDHFLLIPAFISSLKPTTNCLFGKYFAAYLNAVQQVCRVGTT